MSKSMVIVSSKHLSDVVRQVIASKEVTAAFTLNPEGAGLAINGYPVGGLCKGFTEFEVPSERLWKLYTVIAAMGEQPITLSWDGSWFTIQEVLA